MPAFSVVEAFDVIKNISSFFSTGAVFATLNALTFAG